MISEQSRLQHLSNSASQDWRLTLPHNTIGTVAAFVAGEARGVKHFIQIPVLPSAALWEANMLVSMLSAGEKTEYGPDRFSSEASFLSDNWPRSL